MESPKSSRKPKWWNNGWLWFAAMLLTFAVLFVIGRYSATYEPNPKIEGRSLSDWTNDLKSIGWEDSDHHKAVIVLRNHREQVIPVFVTWLRERDTLPQSVYFLTMDILAGKQGPRLSYRGSFYSQLAAARAIKQLEDGRPEVVAALNDVIKQYQGSGHYAARTAQETLEALHKKEAQQDAPSNGG